MGRAMCILAGVLSEEGWRVDLVVPSVGDNGLRVAPGVRVVELGKKRMLTAGRALNRYVRAIRPDVLLTNLVVGNALALTLRRALRWPVRIVAVEHTTVTRFASTSTILRHRLYPAAVRLTYPWADAVVAVSAGVKEDLRRIAAPRSLRLEVVGNPLPLDEMPAMAAVAPADPWFAKGGRPVFLAVGRLSPEKDFATLLRAFAEVRERRAARLVILGEGGERAALERLVRRLGISEDVRLPGTRLNPYAYMVRSSALVLSSYCEGAPTVLFEALVLGCRVVATDCPSGPREILDGGRLGRLVPARNPHALAMAMEAVVEDAYLILNGAAVERMAPAEVARRYVRLLLSEQRPTARVPEVV